MNDLPLKNEWELLCDRSFIRPCSDRVLTRILNDWITNGQLQKWMWTRPYFRSAFRPHSEVVWATAWIQSYPGPHWTTYFSDVLNVKAKVFLRVNCFILTATQDVIWTFVKFLRGILRLDQTLINLVCLEEDKIQTCCFISTVCQDLNMEYHWIDYNWLPIKQCKHVDAAAQDRVQSKFPNKFYA